MVNLFKNPPSEDLTLSKLFGTEATRYHQHLVEETIQGAEFRLKSSARLSCKSKLLRSAMSGKGQEQLAHRLAGRAKSHGIAGTASLQMVRTGGRHLHAHSTVKYSQTPLHSLLINLLRTAGARTEPRALLWQLGDVILQTDDSCLFETGFGPVSPRSPSSLSCVTE